MCRPANVFATAQAFVQDLRRRARTLQLCAACATAWNTFAMVFSARAALVKTALLNHKAAPPLEVVELILEFSRPRVDMLRQAFDNYLSEFLDTSFARPTTSYCCGFYRRRVELKPNEVKRLRKNSCSKKICAGISSPKMIGCSKGEGVRL